MFIWAFNEFYCCPTTNSYVRYEKFIYLVCRLNEHRLTDQSVETSEEAMKGWDALQLLDGNKAH